MISVEGDVTDWWLWKSDSDVLEETSIEVNFRDLDILDDIKDVWNCNVLGVVDTFFGNGNVNTWAIG